MNGYSELTAFFQIVINGILFGSMYGVGAIGLSLIFGSMQIIFIAQGAMMILAAYFAYWMFTLLAVDPFISIVLAIPVFLAVGWGLYAGMFRWIAQAGKNPSMLLAFGLMVVLENLMSLLWTPNTRSIITSYTAWGLPLGSLNISFTRLMVFVISLAACSLVFLFMKTTLWGKAVRAASEDLTAASLMGVSPQLVSGVTFGIGIALAGVAGVATATTYSFDPYFGFIFSLKALIAVAFGGLGSVWGALMGGIMLGLIESLGSYFIGGGWADAISFGMFVLVIMLRPQGLLGRSVVKA